MKKITIIFAFIALVFTVSAQYIPEHISYTRIYDFIDELANDGVIELTSVTKPYSKEYIAKKLLEAQEREAVLNKRQQQELKFYLNVYALEINRLPDTKWSILEREKITITTLQPAIYYRDSLFRAYMAPLLGMQVWAKSGKAVTQRWYGAEFQGMIGKNWSIYGSLRDISIRGDLLSKPSYLNNLPGYEYKESQAGGDYSDSRGGITYSNSWISFGLMKDNVIWGDNYHGSNILSGRAPSFPMLKLQLRPVKWFQLDYFHGWLVSNVKDSTHYSMEDTQAGVTKKQYGMANKFMAANMLTFIPIRNLNISLGNAIIYTEPNVQPAFFIPIAFYKSLSHTLTKGTGGENGNSALFLNLSSRNIKHLHLYASVFADEIKFSRFKSSDPETNPVSYKIGARLSNFPLQNLSLTGEFTRTNIITYKHSVHAATWASNSYNLGHYLGDNSQELYGAIHYKPIRGLDVELSYSNAKHGNEYQYIRGQIRNIISQPALNEITWSNQTLSLGANYEIIKNTYANLKLQYSNIQGYNLTSAPIGGEVREDAQGYLDLFTPKFYQGKNVTFEVGLSFGF
ncbi:MAG: capsule assembly Wzi family protein [Prevotellaceae bacterium]|jgi:hypothetical protein|nr:capsule assembly Wzi family protein [Prevotellaceae bacterium]